MIPQNFKALLDVLERIAKALEKSPLTVNVESGGTVKVESELIKKPSKYTIVESHKYKGCYNIYDKETDNRVKYFAEDDDKNYERAVGWVGENEALK